MIMAQDDIKLAQIQYKLMQLFAIQFRIFIFSYEKSIKCLCWYLWSELKEVSK